MTKTPQPQKKAAKKLQAKPAANSKKTGTAKLKAKAKVAETQTPAPVKGAKKSGKGKNAAGTDAQAQPAAAATPAVAVVRGDTELDVSSLYFRDISEYRILSATEEKAAFEEMEQILRDAWSHALEVPQIHADFSNVIKDVLKANLGRIHEAARTYAAREGDPEVQKILRSKAPGMYQQRVRFSNTLMRIDPDLIILDGVISLFEKHALGAFAQMEPQEPVSPDRPMPTIIRTLTAKQTQQLKEQLKSIRRHRMLITKKRNAFLAANLKLVISVAKKYRGHSLTFDDMIQEGNMGLMTAIGRFDHRLGYKFSTYATWWIRQSITRALSVKDRTIRLPVHLHEIYYRVRRVTADLKEKLSRNPTPEEVAEAASLRPDQIKDYSHLFVEPESLDAGHDSDDDRTLGEFIPDGELVPSDEATEHFRLSEEIKELLKTLTPREEDILRRRFGIGQGRDYTLQEIAERYHLTRERIRQIEAKGLEKLRRPNRRRRLEEYDREIV